MIRHRDRQNLTFAYSNVFSYAYAFPRVRIFKSIPRARRLVGVYSIEYSVRSNIQFFLQLDQSSHKISFAQKQRQKYVAYPYEYSSVYLSEYSSVYPSAYPYGYPSAYSYGYSSTFSCIDYLPLHSPTAYCIFALLSLQGLYTTIHPH